MAEPPNSEFWKALKPIENSQKPDALPEDVQERCWTVLREQVDWYDRSAASYPKERKGWLLKGTGVIAATSDACEPGPLEAAMTAVPFSATCRNASNATSSPATTQSALARNTPRARCDDETVAAVVMSPSPMSSSRARRTMSR